jgi:hypothetical protein
MLKSRSLHFAPYEQAGGLLLANEYSLLIKRTADPSASLGMTKGRGSALIGCGGPNNYPMDVVHSFLNLPQAS